MNNIASTADMRRHYFAEARDSILDRLDALDQVRPTRSPMLFVLTLEADPTLVLSADYSIGLLENPLICNADFDVVTAFAQGWNAKHAEAAGAKVVVQAYHHAENLTRQDLLTALDRLSAAERKRL